MGFIEEERAGTERERERGKGDESRESRESEWRKHVRPIYQDWYSRVCATGVRAFTCGRHRPPLIPSINLSLLTTCERRLIRSSVLRG